jgi:RimJ/RimL family protein N-acetyltransferase
MLVLSMIEGATIDPRNYEAIGVVRDGRLCGGVIYHNYDHVSGNVFVHVAADNPRWALPQTMRDLFAYPFLTLDCIRITATVARKNKRCRKFIKGLGFKEEGIARNGYLKKDDLVIYGMLSGECKFLL